MKLLLTADFQTPKGTPRDEVFDYHDDLMIAIYKALKPYATWEEGGYYERAFRISVEELIQKAKEVIKQDGKKISDFDFIFRLWVDYDRIVRPTRYAGAVRSIDVVTLNSTEYTVNPVCVLEIGNEYKFLNYDHDTLTKGYLSSGKCTPILSLAFVRSESDRPLVRVLVDDINKSCPLVYYHGSGQKIPKGTVFGIRNWESEFSPYVEAIIEYWRPEHMASRLHGVFMANDPINVNLAGGAQNFVYLVQPRAPVHRHDFRWVQSVMLLVGQYGFPVHSKRGNALVAQKEMPEEILGKLIKAGEKFAKSYWNGDMSEGWDVWEYLTNEAMILDQVPRRMYQ